MRSSISLIVLLACITPTRAQQKSTPKLSPEKIVFLETANKPILLTVPGMDRVQVTKYLAYKRTDAEELFADIYRPSAAKIAKAP